MKIIDQQLWDSCPEHEKANARQLMIGSSTAWWLLCDGAHYRITWMGPRSPKTRIVATNLPGQFPAHERATP